MKFIFTFYSWFTDILATAPIARRFGVRPARMLAWQEAGWKKGPDAKSPHAHFHAASVGELEILMPVIEGFLAAQIPLVVTAFSDSAFAQVGRIAGVTWAGPSPRESEWGDFFKKYQVNKVLVSKYEAWPALWIACTEKTLPLILIHARWRLSLAIARFFISLCGFPLPRLWLFAESPGQVTLLRKKLKGATVTLAMDPRWKRIRDRKKLADWHARVQFWRKQSSIGAARPHPWGVVGSAWMEDLRVLLPAFKNHPGTLWVVPHSIETVNLKQIQALLEKEIPGRYLLVNEMGFLLELYSVAQWVWVGGGFGKGIHSTMEPAIYGLPLACGPRNVDQFIETRQLRDARQLSICKNSRQAEVWLREQSHRSLLNPLDEQISSHFSQLIEQCLQIS